MANGKIRFGKQSGGELALVIPDGVANTEVIVPESGVLTTKQYVDDKYSGFKNYIINGNFNIWQRGTSGFSGQNYGADRWMGSVGVQAYSRENVDSLGGYYARIARTTASTSSLLLTQRLEQINVKNLRNKTVTLSFYVRQTIGTVLPINLYIYTPTISDNYTSVVLQETISILPNPTSTFQKVSVSFTVNTEMSLKGFSITIGNLSSGIASIDIQQVQLEEGSVATPFEHRPVTLEMILCQRYYELIYLNAMGAYFTGVHTLNSIEFTVEKRTTPTVTYGSVVYSNSNSLITNGITIKSITPQLTSTSNLGSVNCTIYLSAEL